MFTLTPVAIISRSLKLANVSLTEHFIVQVLFYQVIIKPKDDMFKFHYPFLTNFLPGKFSFSPTGRIEPLERYIFLSAMWA